MFTSGIVNKLIYSFWADCIRLYDSGTGTFEDIDKLCKFGFGHQKGPFETMDETGLDRVADDLKILFERTDDKRFYAPELLIKMRDEGKLGKKGGKGFYDYSEKASQSLEGEKFKSKRYFTGVKKVGVVGFGSMGRGIVQVAAESGFEVVVREVNPDLLEKGIGFIEKMLTAKLEKGKIRESEKKEIMERIKGTPDISGLRESDIVIEAIFEKMDLKKEIFSQIDNILKPEAILTTNTSCLSVTEISSATKRPDRVCGLHFFNPVPLMKLVEVIRTEMTSEETYNKTINFGVALGKETVKSKDSPGFIANRILIPYLYLAMQEYASGLFTKEEIDDSIKLEAGFPMGPFALIDLIGIDVCLDIGEAMFRDTGSQELNPPAFLKEMVKKGYLGRKSGKGFYEYGI